jgi:hypothetical protein
MLSQPSEKNGQSGEGWECDTHVVIDVLVMDDDGGNTFPFFWAEDEDEEQPSLAPNGMGAR